MKHSQTGLRIEKRLYLRAQKRGEELGQSFAAYVADLIAKDLAHNCPDAAGIPDVKRILAIQMPNPPSESSSE